MPKHYCDYDLTQSKHFHYVRSFKSTYCHRVLSLASRPFLQIQIKQSLHLTQEAAIGNSAFRINDEFTEDGAEQMINKITHVMNVNITRTMLAT